ncbi:unnamed protein product [Allacma fusca]|uniref:Uncharacterized protein n=1 Tax=Allacma fusca TaxID=39272 RepID=A0A8J2KRE9_9HEXA|nr:unnamed protein product [Allacma fusca]
MGKFSHCGNFTKPNWNTAHPENSGESFSSLSRLKATPTGTYALIVCADWSTDKLDGDSLAVRLGLDLEDIKVSLRTSAQSRSNCPDDLCSGHGSLRRASQVPFGY